jgi:hypothetical protein
MKMLVVGAALATLVASPAFAQSYGAPRGAYTLYNAVTPFGSPTLVQNGGSGRGASIRQCSDRAAQYKEYTWGDMDIQQYRACMAANGQVE